MTKDELRKSLDFVCDERERLQRENKDLRSAIADYQEAVGDYLQELETRQYDINNLTYQLAMKKAELDEANDSVTWWHNRFNAVQRELERKDNIINELKKWLNEEKDIQGTTIENRIYYDILDKIKELENAKNS